VHTTGYAAERTMPAECVVKLDAISYEEGAGMMLKA
jgi:hypothetical protein